MSETKLYHNPRCSKSREALAYLQENGVAHEVVLYLQQPLSLDEVRALYRKLQLDNPRLMMRVKDDLYRDLGLQTASEDELLQAIAEHSALLERPILETANAAAIGRPLDNIIALLNR
ncbi:MAG: arsenate reductase (glutaredoxin) [Neisseria sp.]|nr:arsenate reductase (glutaredoxin) [Neisseria sp.]